MRAVGYAQGCEYASESSTCFPHHRVRTDGGGTRRFVGSTQRPTFSPWFVGSRSALATISGHRVLGSGRGVQTQQD